MTGGSYPARPARPVADAPIAALADADALAKGWLLTLIAGAPLQSVAEVSTDELAREAPQLCKAIIAALGSDTALARLEDDGDLHAVAARAGGMTGATDAAGSMAAMAALRASLWNAVAEELHHPEPEFVGALATRLSRVCDVVAAAALAQDARVFAASQFADAAGTKHAAQVEPGVSGEPPVAVKPVEPDRPDESAAPSGDAEPTPVAPDTTAPDDVIAHLGVAATPAPLPVPISMAPAEVFPKAAAAGFPRVAEEPWARAVIDRLSRLLAERSGCAVLAVEINDADRLLAADIRGEAAAAIERAERALRAELRPTDTGVRERDGRLWVVAPDTSLEGARGLARRLIAAVTAVGDLHGAPLRTSVGIGASPPDGEDAAALVAHADEGVYAARAAGIALA